jgi:hypothetical protein
MTKLSQSLQHWGSEEFDTSLKQELEQLRADVLPLKEAIDPDNYVIDFDLGVSIINANEKNDKIHAKVGVYFAEEVSCCSCGEGAPTEEAYCEMDVVIDKQSAEASFSVADGYRH